MENCPQGAFAPHKVSKTRFAPLREIDFDMYFRSHQTARRDVSRADYPCKFWHFEIYPEPSKIPFPQSIAILNFVTLWCNKKCTKTVAFIVIGIQWLFVILFVSIGFALHTRSNEYYATPITVMFCHRSRVHRLLIFIPQFWCWLSARFNKERIAGEYFWLWLALFGSILLYLPLFCWYLGIITPDPSRWYKPSPRKLAPSPNDASESERDAVQQSTTQSQSNTVGAEGDQADDASRNIKDHDLPDLRQATQHRPKLGITIW